MYKSLEVYEKFLKSEATKKTYLHYFNAFLKWLNQSLGNSITADGLLEMDQKSLQMYDEEYWGFLTPEACNAVDEYIEERRRDGEAIDSKSPLFRSAYQVGAQKVKPMSIASAKMIALRLAHSVKRNKIGRRYDIMSAHGFRKRFNTILKSNDKANPSLAEKLMGHRGVFALDGSYLKPSVEVLFKEFKKHIPFLAIDDSERNKIELVQKEARIKELEEVNHVEIKEIKDKIKNHDQIMEAFSGLVDNLRKFTGNPNLLKSLEVGYIPDPNKKGH